MLFGRLVFRGAFLPLRTIKAYSVAILGPLIKPALYLWPWILGVGVFAACVLSPQGVALAEGYSKEAYAFRVIIGSIVASWLAVVVASLLALMATSIRDPLERIDDPVARVKSIMEVFAAGLWVVGLSSSQGVLFAQSVHIEAVWVAVGSLIVAGVITTLWIASTVGEGKSAAARVLGAIQRHHFLTISLASLLALAPLALGAFISISNPVRLADAGPLLVAMLGISAVSTLLGLIVVVIPVYLRRPWVGVAFVAAMGGWTAIHRSPIDQDNPLLRDSAEAVSRNMELASCKWTPDSLASALVEHTASPSVTNSLTQFDRDIYLVSAEGGAIRAAYWAALNLAQLDIVTAGRFGEEAASLSGVSGGSLGIATWLAARDREDLSPQARLELAAEFLGSDFLSPLLGGFLFLDAPRLVIGPMWPSARRDQVFEKALADKWQLIGKSDFFDRRMLSLRICGLRVAPAVFFNATDAETGEYVPLARAQLPSQQWLWFENLVPEGPIQPKLQLGYTSLADATVAQMVSISARFPYLSPEAKVGIDAAVLASHAADEKIFKLRESAPREKEALVSEIEARLANIKAERLWSRLWVLVDGGYFDNTGLTPTKEAISFVESKRKEEAKTGPNDATPFTHTRVHVVHISNDPGTPCFALPEGWQKRLSPRAKRFLEVTQQTMRCGHDIAALEDSLRANPLYPLVAPIQSLLAVRGEHSRQALAELRANVPWDRYGLDLEVRELASTLEDAYGTARKPPGHSQDEIVQASIDRRQAAERHAASARDEVERFVRNADVSRSSADAYLKDLSEWQDMVRNESLQVECHKNFAPVGPPLGWTLSKSNQALMRCMLIRREFSEGVRNRLFPTPPYWPSIWLLRYSGVYNVEPRGKSLGKEPLAPR